MALVGAWLGLTLALREHVVRPLGTLANMLAALREGDFSIRARVTDGSDALSLTYMEVNALKEILREQRLGAHPADFALRVGITDAIENFPAPGDVLQRLAHCIVEEFDRRRVGDLIGLAHRALVDLDQV
ncbi:MAG TPA: hypothetical protein EYQ27_12420, partial [Gemmatimonadetes bacterium]|nr:hypothetical protein [Gemmatimonadota bacterium]